MQVNVRNAKLALYTFLEIVALFGLLLIGGCFDWVHWTLSFSKISTAAYWTETAVKTVMYTCAMLIGMLGVLEYSELKDKNYLDAFNVYREKLSYKNQGFVAWVENVLNPKIKKEALKKKFELKLHWLDGRSKDEYKIEYRKKEKDPNYVFVSKKAERYYRKRKMYEEFVSEEYLDENYEILSVWYRKVNPYAFTDFLDIHLNLNLQYKVENKVARDAILHVFNKILLAALCAAVVGLFFVNPSGDELAQQANGWVAIMIRYIVRVFMIAFNFCMGAMTGRKMFSNNYLLPIINRTRILDEYHIYNEDHPCKTVTQEIREKLEAEYQDKLNRVRQEVIDNIAKGENLKEAMGKTNIQIKQDVN